jgi:hypothetical protein
VTDAQTTPCTTNPDNWVAGDGVLATKPRCRPPPGGTPVVPATEVTVTRVPDTPNRPPQAFMIVAAGVIEKVAVHPLQA